MKEHIDNAKAVEREWLELATVYQQTFQKDTEKVYDRWAILSVALDKFLKQKR